MHELFGVGVVREAQTAEAYRSKAYMGSLAALAVWRVRICVVLLGVLAVVRGFV